MRKVLFIVGLAAALVVCGPSYVLADGLSSVDIDPGDCEVSFGTETFDFEPANAHVAANQNWVIAECHVKLSKSQLETIGGPFKQAQHYWDFECLVENDDTAEDLVAFAQHAVLSPSGVLNIMCVAEFVPSPNPDD